MHSLFKAMNASTVRPTAFINEVAGQVVYSGAAGEESIQRRVEAKYHQLLIKVSGDSCPVHLTQPHQCTSWNEPDIQLLIHKQSKWKVPVDMIS